MCEVVLIMKTLIAISHFLLPDIQISIPYPRLEKLKKEKSDECIDSNK